MNHIYRSIWNESTGTVTAVCEHAKRGGKKTSSTKNAVGSSGLVVKSLSVAMALAYGSAGHAAPTGGAVVAGSASIATAPGNTTINQSSQSAALNWQSFDIGIGEAVRFVQPNSNAVALNRVLGADPSSILGSLSSNGKVFLVNPNGILFGTGAQVSVGGLVASTRNIADSDFMAGRYAFSGDSTGSVVNRGSIRADGGYVALLGANVSNRGVIAAKLGSVVLASGNVLTLDVAGDGLINVSVDAGAVDALVQNGGLIQADGGQVLLTARSASNLLQSVVNNTGVIQAQTIENRNGTIRLLGDMQSGTANVGGTLDASAPDGGDGGFIDTSAALVQVANDTKVITAAARGLTGVWLIDPADYNVAASGGNITGAALSSNLSATNITVLASGGSVNVNDTVAWSTNKLTINAYHDVNINTAMNASGTASLALMYGQGAIAAGNTSTVNINAPVNLPAGNNFSMQLGSNGAVNNYVVITSLGAAGSVTGVDLQGMKGNLAGKYVLGANIDAAATSSWNAGAGFVPVGTSSAMFDGTFDGLGHTVSGLTINLPAGSEVGLFGYVGSSGRVRNVGLVGGSVIGSVGTGALAGMNLGTISNSYAATSVSAHDYVGGLVGYNLSLVTDSYATGAVTSSGSGVGGLVGINQDATVSNSYATGAVTGTGLGGSIGGLVGYNFHGHIDNSFATGAVTGYYGVGGLVGSNEGGDAGDGYAYSYSYPGQSATIDHGHATGSVSGNTYVGGLVGRNTGGVGGDGTSDTYGNAGTGGAGGAATIADSYATGTVAGENYVGGLIGGNKGGFGGSGFGTDGMGGAGGAATTTNSYASGAVSGTVAVGGLIGFNIGGDGGNGTSDDVNNIGSGGAGGAATIESSYALGAVSGSYSVGGLAGQNSTGADGAGYDSFGYAGLGGVGAVDVSYSTGAVTGTSGTYTVGGLVGFNTGTVTFSIWDVTTSGLASSDGGTGLTTVQMLTPANYTGFNFTTTAGATGNNWVMVNLNGSLNGATGGTRPMLASEYSTTIVNAHQLQLMNMNVAASYMLADNLELAAELTGASGIWGSSTAGFVPIGRSSSPFTGTFDGRSHTIGGLMIDQPLRPYTGLFGSTAAGAAVRNVGLVGGSVIGEAATGSLVGQNGGAISNSYATTSVSGPGYIGGLVGFQLATGTIDNAYATGSVSGVQSGGLVGRNLGTIRNSYATGLVSGDAATGGLVGFDNGGTVVRSFWNTETSGNSTSAGGGTGLTTAEMMQLASFSSWNTNAPNTIADTGGSGATWRIYEGHTAPLLTSFMTALTLTDTAVTYDGAAHSRASGISSGVFDITAATNAGVYSFYSNQQGYDIAGGTLTIGKANLLLSGTRTYDGSTTVAGSALTAMGIAGESFAVTGLGDASNLASKNVQAGSALSSVTGLAVGAGVNGGISSNYNALGTAGSSFSITRADLTLASGNVVKTYDGGLTAAGTATVTGGTLFGTDAISGGTFAFTNGNPGIGNKTVTATNVTVNDGNGGGNYNVRYADNVTSTIVEADIPPVIVTPPPAVVPLTAVTSTARYLSAVGLAVSNYHVAPQQVNSSALFPVLGGAIPLGSIVTGPMPYDLTGLNLTIVRSDDDTSAIQPQAIPNDKK